MTSQVDDVTGRCEACRTDCPQDRGEACACDCHLAEETPSLGWD